MSTYIDDALGVSCPWCLAPAGKPCTMSHGRLAYKTHSDRIKSARKAETRDSLVHDVLCQRSDIRRGLCVTCESIRQARVDGLGKAQEAVAPLGGDEECFYNDAIRDALAAIDELSQRQVSMSDCRDDRG